MYGGVWPARQDGVSLFDDPCKRSEIEIVACKGDVVCGPIDYGLRCYSTMISAVLVAPSNGLPMLPVKLAEQEASRPVKSTASNCVDLSGHGNPQRSSRYGGAGKASGIASMFTRAPIVLPAAACTGTASDLPLWSKEKTLLAAEVSILASITSSLHLSLPPTAAAELLLSDKLAFRLHGVEPVALCSSKMAIPRGSCAGHACESCHWTSSHCTLFYIFAISCYKESSALKSFAGQACASCLCSFSPFHAVPRIRHLLQIATQVPRVLPSKARLSFV
jgi:hypothetical protein